MQDDKQPDHIKPLDGLRGFAAFWVFVVHIMYAGLAFKSFPFNGSHNMGSLGVSLFFVLSGFLLGYLYWDKAFTSTTVKAYLVSRFSRIAPAYLFIVITAYLIVHFVDAQYVYNISSTGLFIRHLLFAGNANALWSISPEVQFYLFFVLTWYAFQTRSHNNVWLVVTLLAILLMIIGYIPKGTLLSTHIQLFLFGAIAGHLRKTVRLKSNTQLILIQVFSFVMTFIYCAYLVKNYNYYKPYHVIDYALLVAVTVFSMSFSTRLTALTFETAAMRYLGKISFSLYLLNPVTVMYAERLTKTYPAAGALIFAGLIAGTLTLSGLMYRWIEMPAQRFIKQRLQPVK